MSDENTLQKLETEINVANEARHEIIETLFRVKEFSKEIEQRGSVNDNFESYKFTVYTFREFGDQIQKILDSLSNRIEKVTVEYNDLKEKLDKE